MTELLIIYRNTQQDIVMRGSYKEMAALFDAIFSSKTKQQTEMRIVGNSGDLVMVSPMDIVHMALIPENTEKIN